MKGVVVLLALVSTWVEVAGRGHGWWVIHGDGDSGENTTTATTATTTAAAQPLITELAHRK